MTLPTDPALRSLRLQTELTEWPKIDQDLWALAVEAGDVLSSAESAATWTNGTLTTVRKGYGRWISWLKSEGRLDPNQRPVARAKPEIVAAFVSHITAKENSTITIWSYVRVLCMALKVMEPAADITSLWAIERRLCRKKTPTRRKAGRIVPIAELYKMGLLLMDQATICRDSDHVTAARNFRDGMLIAVLAARPVRLRNLQSIQIGKNLIELNGTFYLVFREDETKTHKALEFALPGELSSRMAVYLSIYRPILAGQTMPPHIGDHCAAGDALWVSQFGSALGKTTIYTIIVDATRKHFGHPINPHFFRDCAATSTALEDPEHVHITMSILGHASLATSERYYNHAQAVRVVKMHQTEILAARRAHSNHLARERLAIRQRRRAE